jgi:hypothetical protein
LSLGKFGDRGTLIGGDAIPIANGCLYHASEAGQVVSVSPAQGIKETKIVAGALEGPFVCGFVKDRTHLEKRSQGRFLRDVE